MRDRAGAVGMMGGSRQGKRRGEGRWGVVGRENYGRRKRSYLL